MELFWVNFVLFNRYHSKVFISNLANQDYLADYVHNHSFSPGKYLASAGDGKLLLVDYYVVGSHFCVNLLILSIVWKVWLHSLFYH